MATIATSVSVVDGPLADAAQLDARLGELRSRFPRAVLDRYLRSFRFPPHHTNATTMLS